MRGTFILSTVREYKIAMLRHNCKYRLFETVRVSGYATDKVELPIFHSVWDRRQDVRKCWRRGRAAPVLLFAYNCHPISEQIIRRYIDALVYTCTRICALPASKTSCSFTSALKSESISHRLPNVNGPICNVLSSFKTFKDCDVVVKIKCRPMSR